MKLIKAKILIEEEGKFEDILSAIDFFSRKYKNGVIMLVEVIEDDEIPPSSNLRLRRRNNAHR